MVFILYMIKFSRNIQLRLDCLWLVFFFLLFLVPIIPEFREFMQERKGGAKPFKNFTIRIVFTNRNAVVLSEMFESNVRSRHLKYERRTPIDVSISSRLQSFTYSSWFAICGNALWIYQNWIDSVISFVFMSTSETTNTHSVCHTHIPNGRFAEYLRFALRSIWGPKLNWIFLSLFWELFDQSNSNFS